MTKINQSNQTPESGEVKQKNIQQKIWAIILTTIKGGNASANVILTEEEKREIRQFLSSMEGTKKWCRKTGDINEAEEIQKKFIQAGAHIRWSKEIIKKLWSMQYTAYDSWSNYLGVHTYHYNEEYLEHATPEILNDKKFMLELITENKGLANYISPNLLQDKKFILSIIDILAKDKETRDVSHFYEIMQDTLKEDEDILEKILWVWAVHAIKKYLIKKDSKILDNRKIMKKLILADWWYDRHKYPKKIREDKEYILLLYKNKEWLKTFYTFSDKDKPFYNGFLERVKNILVEAWETREDEVFLKQMYAKNPDMDKNIPNLDADILRKYADTYDFKDNKDIKKIRSYKDIVTLMDKYIKRVDVEQMAKLIKYLEKYENAWLGAYSEQYVEQFIKENDIKDIDEKFLALSENERLLITLYWHSHNRNTEDMNFGCGWHGGFKTPTEHDSCITWKKNLERANLVKLAEYKGDRCYRIPEKLYTNAQDEMIKKNQSEISQNLDKLKISIKWYTSIYRECEERAKKVEALNAIIKDNQKISSDDLLNMMPEFVEHIMGLKDGCHSIRVDLKNKIWSYIKWYSDYNGSGWSEYGLYINAWYAGSQKSQKVVYRDRYDPTKDDRSLNFNTLDIKEVGVSPDHKEIKITLSAKSKDRTKEYNFAFAVKELDTTKTLDKAAQERFLENFSIAKNTILLEQKKRYEGRMMPVYCLPAEMTYNGMPWGDVPYKTPEIVQESIDVKKGVGMVVIYTQIDHSVTHKRQMAREGYLITQDGKYSRAVYELLWDHERLWGRNVVIDTQEMIQKYQNK